MSDADIVKASVTNNYADADDTWKLFWLLDLIFIYRL